jgi:hypothetical protein
MISVYQSTVKQKCKMRDKPNNVYRLLETVGNNEVDFARPKCGGNIVCKILCGPGAPAN